MTDWSPSRWLAVLLLSGLGWIGVAGGGCAGKRHGAEVGGRPPLAEEYRELARGALGAVEIRGHSLATVRVTAESVYTRAGFVLVVDTPGDGLVFERAGSRSQVAAYGNWQGTQVRIRLKLEFHEPGLGRVLAMCRSYVVRDAGGPFEDEQSLSRRRVREYEPLLYEVAERLNGTGNGG